ncbi:probable sucrose-phosphatase 3 [Spinacia oleracea]|uniref:Probable sucrose-phosphatase 3 n=1 Tax=Spinacia oleracea TaxID=3562 RepID=A0ABM3RED1_SPIOL|nr:probable sucrose-phosphatase 3 [Spinacia oleracea]XP_056696538.1 probable sucrose-phosphatase 3 [Spinacia oleracea]
MYFKEAAGEQCHYSPKLDSFLVNYARQKKHPSGGFIHPSGEELSLYDSIDKLKKCYGDRQGTKYRVWIDRLLPTRISNDAWLVRFDKWETSGKTFK